MKYYLKLIAKNFIHWFITDKLKEKIMKISSYQSNQTFGMAIHSNANVNKILQSRIKKVKDLEKLNKIIEQEAKNKSIDITILANTDNTTLCGNIYSTNANTKFFKSYSENFLTKIIQGPVGFIEKLANIADKQAAKYKEANSLNFDEVFNKLK